jgi:hypothetical protein
VPPFGVVELQRPGDRLQHRLGRAGQVPPLQAHVVIDRDPGQHRDLLPAQPGYTATIATLDAGRSLFIDHRDPDQVARLGNW